MAEQRETDKRMMAEQHDRFLQLLQEVQIPHERNPPPPPAPRLHIQKFCEETDDMAAYLKGGTTPFFPKLAYIFLYLS